MNFKKHQNDDGTWNGVSMLAELSSLSPDEISRIAGEVKANQQKLNGCQWHDFQLHEAKQLSSRSEYRCKHCGGVIQGDAYRWHELGRRPKP